MNAPQNSHPVTPVSSATRIDSTEPTTVTAFALIPSLTHSCAIGSMIRFQPLRNRSTAYPPHISRMSKPGNAGFPYHIRINDPFTVQRPPVSVQSVLGRQTEVGRQPIERLRVGGALVGQQDRHRAGLRHDPA